MDSTTAFDIPRDDAAARNRFENFKLGKGLPLTVGAKHGHGRSHSRNLSISSSLSLPPSSKSTNLNDLSNSHFSLPALSPTLSPSPTSLTHPIGNPGPPSKRNSHHRRRSSVSTRHESAEMMGVALPDLPASTSDDNINLGEKDSIRRRALWALEGKPDVSFSKVEIPDISTPDVEKMIATKSSSYGSGLNSLSGNKRDSFKLLAASSSSKDTLHTLVEEEEEEDEPLPSPAFKENVPPPNTPITPVTPALSITRATPAKSRPSNLNLRPLSLTPDNLSSSTAPSTASLPSPSLTPSPRLGLRSLALSPTPVSSASVEDFSSSDAIAAKQARRHSLVISPTPPSRKPILNLALEKLESSIKSSDEDAKPARRSSISYKRSSSGVTVNIAGLPTPEMTPTFGRRYSINSNASDSLSINNASADDEFFPSPPTQTRPLSASEQHFLFKSHNALLARITDLEKALSSSMRRRESGGWNSNGSSSRPMSSASNLSSLSDGGFNATLSPAGEPSDEMLRLIADLKAERDELKRDVDGWRTRVGDMEGQLSVVTKRVENERRDAWVARSRVGLLEVEKGVLTRKAEGLEEMCKRHEEIVKGLEETHEKEKKAWEDERGVLVDENALQKERVEELEAELEQVKKQLDAEREKAKKVKESDELATPTPRSFGFGRPSVAKTHGLGFMSVDSESSTTDVDPDSSSDDAAFNFGLDSSSDDVAGFNFGRQLKSVQEERDDEYNSEEENALAGYEDEEEEDADTSMSLGSSSSFGSEEDLPRPLHQNRPSSPTTPRPQVFTPPRPSNHGHARRATLSKTWTFPFGHGGQPQTPPRQEEEKENVDKFFGCLEDGDSDTTSSMPSSPSAYSYEKTKGVFASGFKFAPADDNASFFLPGGVGMPADVDDERLAVVAEEDEVEEENSSFVDMSEEDDDDMFGEIGGIRITFTPPQEDTEVKQEEWKQIQVTSPVKRTSPPPTLPALDFGDDEEEEEEEEEMGGVIPFNFGRSLMDERGPSPTERSQPSPPPTVTTVPVISVSAPAPVSVPVVITSPPSTLTRPASPSMIPRSASPSSIPRAVGSTCKSPLSQSVSSLSSSISSDSSTSTPPPKPLTIRAVPASPSPASSNFVTPPNKRGGALPSFIPQPVSSPSPLRVIPSSTRPTAPKVTAIPTSTFIRQPSTRKPLLPVNPKATGSAISNGSTLIPQPPVVLPASTRSSLRRPSDDEHVHSSAQMNSIDLLHDRIFTIQRPTQPSTASTRPHPHPTTFESSQPPSTSTVPPLTASSSASISSFMSMSPPMSARLSLQTITNFIPLSWAARSSAPAPTPPTPDFHDFDGQAASPAVVPVPAQPRKSSGYVSRDKQLRKLKARMEVEGVLAMGMAVGVNCRKCDGGIVCI